MLMLAGCETRRVEPAGVARGIEKRIFFLDPADRKLLEMTLNGRLTRREAGLLVGLSAGQVTRRVHGLLRRLNAPVVRKLVDEGALLPEGYRDVGLAYFLRNRSVAAVAAEFGYSQHAIKRIITYVRGWQNGRREEARRRRRVRPTTTTPV